MSTPRPPLPPFTEQTAREKVQLAEEAWNSRDPERVALAYTPDTEWRNRADFVNGREEVVADGVADVVASADVAGADGAVAGAVLRGEDLEVQLRGIQPVPARIAET